MNRLTRTGLLLLTLTLVALSFSLPDQAFAQAGRRSSEGKQKKNPNASGDPEQERKQREKEIEKQVDKSIEQGTIKIGTEVVNVEAVVYNKKTGAIQADCLNRAAATT